MMLRKMRWLTAGLLSAAALLAAPAKSQAGIQVLVQELDGSLANFGSAQYFTGAINSGITTANFQNIAITVTTSSGLPNPFNSLTTTVNMRPGTSFDPTHALRVWVTDDGFINTFVGQPALVQNNAAASSAIGGGQNSVTNNTLVLSLPVDVPTTNPPTDSPIGPATGDATDIRPSAIVSPTTIAGIGALPGTFAMQQTITIRATPFAGQTINPNSTLGGSASSLVLSNTPLPPVAGVPAPGGLVLALIGLPLLGARRLRRTKA